MPRTMTKVQQPPRSNIMTKVQQPLRIKDTIVPTGSGTVLSNDLDIVSHNIYPAGNNFEPPANQIVHIGKLPNNDVERGKKARLINELRERKKELSKVKAVTPEEKKEKREESKTLTNVLKVLGAGVALAVAIAFGYHAVKNYGPSLKIFDKYIGPGSKKLFGENINPGDGGEKLFYKYTGKEQYKQGDTDITKTHVNSESDTGAGGFPKNVKQYITKTPGSSRSDTGAGVFPKDVGQYIRENIIVKEANDKIEYNKTVIKTMIDLIKTRKMTLKKL